MKLQSFLSENGTIAEIKTESIVLEDSFLNIAERFSKKRGTVALVSGGDLDCARYHILAVNPWLSLTTRKNRAEFIFDHAKCTFEETPQQMVKEITRHYAISSQILPKPVSAGLFGYLSYDLKDSIETLPRTTVNDLELPDICLYAPRFILVYDKVDQHFTLAAIRLESDEKTQFSEELNAFKHALKHPLTQKKERPVIHGTLTSNFNQLEYMDAVNSVKEYISKGDVYQVNISQRFETHFEGDAFSVFEMLYEKNPAPFYAFVHAGDHIIISTSPERFIKRMGPCIETRPIKGTRPRSCNPVCDEALKSELLSSKKDDAELSMIVDLLRNDIGKVCKAGSVSVTEHKRLEPYQNVYHLVTTIKGTLAPSVDASDIISATFPGGSITGCPKIRSMEIIDELESHRRHIYTGSIGYIGFHDVMDLSIAIRTATIFNNRLFFSVGGGIVYDSDPLEEYEETLHKGETFRSLFKNASETQKRKPFVWQNGKMVPANNAAVPIQDLGFQYGFGFFETIFARNGKTPHLKDHLKRFSHSFHHLFGTEPPDLSWDIIIGMVLEKNHLIQKDAAVKIIATKGIKTEPPYDHTFIVSARPYLSRLSTQDASGMDKKALSLGIYPYPRQSPLACHKTLNYLYYYLAGKWAKDNGFDEALILNPDNTISETHTANILLINNQRVIQPESPHVLGGVMQKIVCEILFDRGFEIEKRKVRAIELFQADQVLLTNALMGALPVHKLDGKALSFSSDLHRIINSELF